MSPAVELRALHASPLNLMFGRMSRWRTDSGVTAWDRRNSARCRIPSAQGRWLAVGIRHPAPLVRKGSIPRYLSEHCKINETFSVRVALVGAFEHDKPGA